MPGYYDIWHSRPGVTSQTSSKVFGPDYKAGTHMHGCWHNVNIDILHCVGIGNAHVMLYSKTDQLECNNHLRLWVIYLSYEVWSLMRCLYIGLETSLSWKDHAYHSLRVNNTLLPTIFTWIDWVSTWYMLSSVHFGMPHLQYMQKAGPGPH